MNPRVSVSITTYNHAAFIGQALDSVLDQEVDFDYEVLVGEDDSTDGTRDIVRDYQRRYPDRIRAFLNDRSNVIYIGGLPTGRWNMVNNFRHARGDYVAMLDGDDYWTDPTKLRRQVAVLDASPEYSLCFHDAEVLAEDGTTERFCRFDQDRDVSIESVLREWLVPTGSIMFRRTLLSEFPAWFYKVFSGDYSIQLLLADQGPFRYIDRMMSVYRRHPGAMTNQLQNRKFRNNLALLLHWFNEGSDRRQEAAITSRLVKEFENLARYRPIDNRNPLEALRSLALALRYHRRGKTLTVGKCVGMLARWPIHLARTAVTRCVKAATQKNGRVSDS